MMAADIMNLAASVHERLLQIAKRNTVMKREGHPVSWREFELNLQKLTHAVFGTDVPPLLATGHFDAHAAWAFLAPRLQSAWEEAAR